MSTGMNNRGFGRTSGFGMQRGLIYGVIILMALLAFEAFNYSSTQHALTDLLGDLQFLGFRWATILSIAFCGIDFAGIARLFTPDQGGDERNEVWYLFGAWLLAATMNAILTWWGVSIALINHQTVSSAVLDPNLIIRAVPIVVAVMVWLIRILIIGTFSLAGDRIFSLGGSNEMLPMRAPSASVSHRPIPNGMPAVPATSFSPRPPQQAPSRYVPSHRPSHQDINQPVNVTAEEHLYSPVGDPGNNAPEPVYIPENGYAHSEPAYQPTGGSARSTSRGGNRSMD